MFLRLAFDALKEAAHHPLALGMYVLVVVSWLLISWRVKRHRILLRNLQKLPEEDRLKALELEIGRPLPRDGIDAEEWLRSRDQSFRLARLGILSLTAIMVFSLAVFYFVQIRAATKALVVSGDVRLDDRTIGNATISIVGFDGQWTTHSNGAFKIETIDAIESDSITLRISCSTNFETLSLDTTISKYELTGIQLRLKTPMLCIIAGQVLESVTKDPVSGARVILAEDRGSDITNSLDYFRFEVRGRPTEPVKAMVVLNDQIGYDGWIQLSQDIYIPFQGKP